MRRKPIVVTLLILTMAFVNFSGKGISLPVARASSPGAPPGCPAPTTTNFTNSTAVTISATGTPLITSTIVVSGLDTHLFDLDVQTFITHTNNADLDMTIMSPAGTVVTLTTDNGGTADNVYNGTVWDDSANPGGAAPYASNNGLTTDHTYVNLTTASPLAPEEALAAFIGENPNGTWTLTISDDANTNGGALNSWSIAVTTLPFAPTVVDTQTFTNNTMQIIPSTAPPNVLTSIVTASMAGTYIGNVSFNANITHTFPGDLDMTIASPSGRVVTISTNNGSTNEGVSN